jgi:hypothetical protein
MTVEPRALLAILLAPDGAAALRNDDDLRVVTEQAARLGAEGLLHAAIRRAGDAAPDVPALRERLRRAHAAITAKNLELMAETRRVLDALARRGLVATPMKGAALFREGVVRDLGTRPTTDLDLVIAPRERERVRRSLERLGYTESASERSWKHLPAMRRGDLAIELHEVAWWSGTSRRTFGVDHLAVDDGSLRLGRLWALQIHHLVLGSPPDPALLVRTLADHASFAARARADRRLTKATEAAAEEAGLAPELAACDAIVAEARGDGRVVGGAADPAIERELLAPLTRQRKRDERVEVLAHFLRTARRQPLGVSFATLRILLEPPAGASTTRARERTRRALSLASRVGAALPAALRRALER